MPRARPRRTAHGVGEVLGRGARGSHARLGLAGIGVLVPEKAVAGPVSGTRPAGSATGAGLARSYLIEPGEIEPRMRRGVKGEGEKSAGARWGGGAGEAAVELGVV